MEAKEADMGCWHGHGSWCGWPLPRGWYGEPADEPGWFEEQGWPVRPRRYRRERPVGRETAASLETRLDELRDELGRVEAALGELRRPAGEEPEQR
jgi:hypothetical protein